MPERTDNPEKRSIVEASEIAGRFAPWVLLCVGIVAAFGPGKLPPLLPTIQTEFGLSLLAGGWLVAVFQVAAASLGVLGGALADRFGARRVMQAGLCIGIVSAVLGAWAAHAGALFVSRIGESLGFTLAALPAAALYRRSVPPTRVTRWLGIWSTYMPAGMAIGLLVSPLIATAAGWRMVWQVHALAMFACLLALRSQVPGDRAGLSPVARFVPLVRRTLRAPGPWLLAACFAVYAGQYLVIVSFLPSVYQAAGIAMTEAGALTALVAGINVIGNISAGQIAHRGWPPGRVIAFAALVLLLGPPWVFAGEGSFAARYAVICAVSMIAGLIPGTLFTLSPRFAPGPDTVSTTVGLMQQGSGAGQVILPPIVAAVAMSAGGWQLTGWATGVAAVLTIVCAWAISAYDRHRRLARNAPAAS
ncbi:MAG: MFS transporter [Burkholderiaceae bacterium]